MQNEIWKKIPFNPNYEVSNFARVKSTKRISGNIKGGKYDTTELILKGWIDKYGYVIITIYNEKRIRKNLRVHRLVAEAFIPNENKKLTINHKNGIKDDNRIENLEWATYQENIKHAYRTGLNKGMSGKNNYSKRVPVIQMDMDGVFIKQWESALAASKELKIYTARISNAVKNKIKHTGGFKWKYAEPELLKNF